jgi:hypothetical protein
MPVYNDVEGEFVSKPTLNPHHTAVPINKSASDDVENFVMYSDSLYSKSTLNP